MSYLIRIAIAHDQFKITSTKHEVDFDFKSIQHFDNNGLVICKSADKFTSYKVEGNEDKVQFVKQSDLFDKKDG